MSASLNPALAKLPVRAERVVETAFLDTFVDNGSVTALLARKDHQILYGRRGTGKTHALYCLRDIVTERGDVAAYIDMRPLGAPDELYGNPKLSLEERVARVYVDIIANVHNSLRVFAENSGNPTLPPMLDSLADCILSERVEGTYEQEITVEETNQVHRGLDASLQADSKGVTAGLTGSRQSESGGKAAGRVLEAGVLVRRVHFQEVSSILHDLLEHLPNRNLWILLDEWSDVPHDIQPHVADCLRRSLFPLQTLVVKLSAVEQRSHFRDHDLRIGLEVGADTLASVDLDELLTFRNDFEEATRFLRELLFRHLRVVLLEEETTNPLPESAEDFAGVVFADELALQELVIAAAGVPRDGINVLSLAAQMSGTESVSRHSVREAAKRWYRREKQGALVGNESARETLNVLIEDVIAERRRCTFVLAHGDLTSDPRFRPLYDARVVHLVALGFLPSGSSPQRYDLCSLDYGCLLDRWGEMSTMHLDPEEAVYARDTVEELSRDRGALVRAIPRLVQRRGGG